VPVEVVLVRWPVEDERRGRLAGDGVPRLLLVERDAEPPEVYDPLEDWVRVPADELEISARLNTLGTRARARMPKPTLDLDGVLRTPTGWVALPPVEGRLVGRLLDRLGTVVSREMLGEAGWPDGAPGRNALDVHMLRLRRRLSPVGLSIRTVRSRGYLLEVTEASRQVAP
jgi:DNA-binding response OmpR family regulator